MKFFLTEITFLYRMNSFYTMIFIYRVNFFQRKYKKQNNYMRENAAFVKNIHAFFLKCNYFSNSFATFKQPQIVGRRLPLMSSSYLEHDCLSYLYRQWHIYYGL